LGFNGGNSAWDYAHIDKVIERSKIKKGRQRIKKMSLKMKKIVLFFSIFIIALVIPFNFVFASNYLLTDKIVPDNAVCSTFFYIWNDEDLSYIFSNMNCELTYADEKTFGDFSFIGLDYGFSGKMLTTTQNCNDPARSYSGCVALGNLTLNENFALVRPVGSIFPIPLTAVADLTGFISPLFTDLWVVIALACGFPIAFYAIRKLILLAKSRV
jgi:hypothetical protein